MKNTLYIKKVMAFTLAEVLITLAVIGVVAVLTIPTLILNSEKKENLAYLQKAVSTITTVSTQLRFENGNSMANLATTNIEFANLFQPYMKFTSVCQDASDSETCYIKNTDTVRNLQGGNYGGVVNLYTDRAKIVTPEGFVYMFELNSPTCTGAKHNRGGLNDYCGVVAVDINGVKLPNTVGKDIFNISINKDSATPYKDMEFPNLQYCSLASTEIYNGASCSYKAIMESGIYYY